LKHQRRLSPATLGNYERAIDHYLTLSKLAPDNVSVHLAGMRAAEHISQEVVTYFRSSLSHLQDPKYAASGTQLDEGACG